MALPVFETIGAFTTSAGDVTPPLPSGIVSGDLLLLFVETANQAVPSAPSGWTQVTNSPQGTGTAGSAGGVRLTVFSRLATGSESAPTVSDSGDHNSAAIARFSGVHQTTPINVTAGSVLSTGATDITLPAVTTTVADCLIVAAVATDRDASSTTTFSGWANENLSDLTERLDQTQAGNTGGGLGMAEGGKATAGNTSTTGVEQATAVTAGMMTIAIAPPAAGAGDPDAEPSYHVLAEFVTGSYTNITGDVKGVTITRAISDLMSGISAGECNIELYNISGDYSPSNPAGQFFGNLKPNRQIRVLGVYDSATYQLFQGFADEFAAGGAGKLGGTAVIRARDQFRGFRGRTLSTSLYVDINVASLFVNVFSLSGITSFAVSKLGDSVPFAWFQEAEPSNAINEIVALGFSRIFVDGAGIVRVKDRYYEVDLTTVGSYTDLMDLTYTDNNDRIYNDFFMEGVPRQEETNISTLAYITEPISIAASSHVAFVMEYIRDLNSLPVPATRHDTPVSSLDWILGTAKGTSADRTATGSVTTQFFGATCVTTVFNGSGDKVFLNKFNIRGYAVPEIAKLSVRTRNTSSQNVFGRSSFSFTSDKLQGVDYLRDYQTFLIGRLKDPTPLVGIVMRNQFPDLMSLDLGQKIAIVNSHTGVRSLHIIGRIEHNIDTSLGFVHTVAIDAERYRAYSLFTLDDAILGKLDAGNNVLAF